MKKSKKVKKTFVLDTNVLLHTPYALHSFEDNNIVIPEVVLEELESRCIARIDN